MAQVWVPSGSIGYMELLELPDGTRILLADGPTRQALKRVLGIRELPEVLPQAFCDKIDELIRAAALEVHRRYRKTPASAA